MNGLLLALLWALLAARAQKADTDEAAETNETETSEYGDAFDEEIIVFDDLEIARRRGELDGRIRGLGYRAGKKRDGRTIYHAQSPWKPSVVIHDEGFVTLKRAPVRFESYADGPLKALACIPPFTIMCVRIGGQVISRRKLAHQKSAVSDQIQPEVTAWRTAVIARHHEHRAMVEVPAALTATWEDGLPLDGGPALPDPAARRRAILDFWGGRACTEEGDAVAEVVATFVELGIDASEHPTTAEERVAANASARCGRKLPVSETTP